MVARWLTKAGRLHRREELSGGTATFWLPPHDLAIKRRRAAPTVRVEGSAWP